MVKVATKTAAKTAAKTGKRTVSTAGSVSLTDFAKMSEKQRAKYIQAITREVRAVKHAAAGGPIVADPSPIELRRTARMPPTPWPEIARRNLLFHVLPLRNPARVWQWHIAQLRKHLSLFNGQRIVTIATSGDTGLPLDSPREVRAAFGKDARKIKFLELDNDGKLWEGPALLRMLGMAESRNDSEASFYFHAKGVRRLDQSAIRPWCQAIYKHTMANADAALESLRHAKACGIVLRDQDPTGARQNGQGGWHFSGNAWWVRHDALFVRGWETTLQPHTHGAEAFLATRFDRHEVHELAALSGDVYDPATWSPDARPIRVSIIVTARNYARFLRDCLQSCFDQYTPAHEVIYCDDASQDESLAVARKFHGLKVIPLKKNLGVVDARNHAAAHATGNALLFVDGDNILPRNFLSATTAQLHYTVPFVYTDLGFFGQDTGYAQQPEWGHFDLWQENHCDTCSLIRREAFDAAGGWQKDPTGGTWCAMEDYHLFLRLSLFGAARRAPVALGYRRHGQSLTAASGRDGNPALLHSSQQQIQEHARQWAIEKFGRLPDRRERDNGVLLG